MIEVNTYDLITITILPLLFVASACQAILVLMVFIKAVFNELKLIDMEKKIDLIYRRPIVSNMV
jgi:hypothetical protein